MTLDSNGASICTRLNSVLHVVYPGQTSNAPWDSLKAGVLDWSMRSLALTSRASSTCGRYRPSFPDMAEDQDRERREHASFLASDSS